MRFSLSVPFQIIKEDKETHAGLPGGAETSGWQAAPRPAAVVAFHGTNDSAIPYNGFGVPGEIHESYLRIGTPIPTWALAWAGRNGCNTRPSTIFQEGQMTGQEWGDCRAGADVVLYTIDGGTHSWPAGLSGPTGEITAAQMIWDFFTRHPFVADISQ